MAKGLLIGSIVGALLAAGAYRAFAWHRSPATPDPAAPAAASPSETAAPDPELAALKLEGERLRGELASLEKPAGETGAKAAGKKALTWKELGARVYRMKDQLKNHDGDSEGKEDLMGDFLALLSEAALKDGVSVEEAILGPGGMLGLLLGVLGGSDLPPDAGQQAKIDAAMAAVEKEWKEYIAGKDGLTGMERARDLLAIAGGGVGGIRGALRPDQLEMLDKLEMFDDVPSMTPGSPVRGDRASVSAQLGDQWKTALKLDDTQAVSIVPIVDEYMRAYDEIQAEAARKRAAGEKVTEWTTAQKEADLLVAVQKRMKETLRLTEEQERAMKAWKGKYGYEVTTK